MTTTKRTKTDVKPSSGYRYCAHDRCMAIVIGKAGTVCDDCAEHDENPSTVCCYGCDHDGDDAEAAEGGAS
jgi:hypothetical protein